MNNEPNLTAALFPILQPPPLSGLARIAAEGEHIEDGHRIEFRTMEVRSILNRSISRRQLSLDLSINPYRGCEFGCRYCYARYTHGFLAPARQLTSAQTGGPVGVGINGGPPHAPIRRLRPAHTAHGCR